MIENKEEYRKKGSDILDRQNELLEKIEAVDSVKAMLEAYNCNIDDLKERLEDEMDAAEYDYHEHTKEESKILAKIIKEFSSCQIEHWFAQGYDTVDLVNAYLRGELDRFQEKQ